MRTHLHNQRWIIHVRLPLWFRNSIDYLELNEEMMDDWASWSDEQREPYEPTGTWSLACRCLEQHVSLFVRSHVCTVVNAYRLIAVSHVILGGTGISVTRKSAKWSERRRNDAGEIIEDPDATMAAGA